MNRIFPPRLVHFTPSRISSAEVYARPKGRWLRVLAFAGLTLYAICLVVSPFVHDDLSCELKTPQHCIACRSSLVGSDPKLPVVAEGSDLADAGRAVSVEILAHDTLLVIRSTGRSPPAQA